MTMASYTIGRQEQVRIPAPYGGGFVDAFRVWFTSQPSGTVAWVNVPIENYPAGVGVIVAKRSDEIEGVHGSGS